MNPDALSDLVLLLVCATVAWRDLRTRPAIAVGAGLVVDFALHPHLAGKHVDQGLVGSVDELADGEGGNTARRTLRIPPRHERRTDPGAAL